MAYQIMITDERLRSLLPIHVVTVGSDFKQPPRDLHAFPFHQLLLVSSGEGIAEDESGIHRLTAGRILFTAKGSAAAYRGTTEDFRTGWVTFDGPQAESILEYFRAGSSAILESEAARGIMYDIWMLAKRNAAPELLSRRAYELIVTFFGTLNDGRKSRALVRAKEYVEAHYASDLSVSDIALDAGVSEAQLFRLFHAEACTSPAIFLRDVRIRHAKEILLDSPQMRIAEVAERTGFADAAYFCKVFRAVTGMTPKTYRAQYLL